MSSETVDYAQRLAGIASGSLFFSWAFREISDRRMTMTARPGPTAEVGHSPQMLELRAELGLSRRMVVGQLDGQVVLGLQPEDLVALCEILWSGYRLLSDGGGGGVLQLRACPLAMVHSPDTAIDLQVALSIPVIGQALDATPLKGSTRLEMRRVEITERRRIAGIAGGAAAMVLPRLSRQPLSVRPQASPSFRPVPRVDVPAGAAKVGG